MKTKTKDVYYCDHCKKKGLGKWQMERHEQYCHANPQNASPCFNCRYFEQRIEDIAPPNASYRHDIKYFFCSKKAKRLHPLSAVRKNLIERYPETFEDSELVPKSCELTEPVFQ